MTKSSGKVTIKLTAEDMNRLKALAASEERTAAGQARLLLKQHLDMLARIAARDAEREGLTQMFKAK